MPGGFKDWAELNKSQTKKAATSDTSSMGPRQSSTPGGGPQDPAVVEAVLRRLKRKGPQRPPSGMSMPFKPVK